MTRRAADGGAPVAGKSVGVIGTGLASLIFALTERPYKRTADALP